MSIYVFLLWSSATPARNSVPISNERVTRANRFRYPRNEARTFLSVAGKAAPTSVAILYELHL